MEHSITVRSFKLRMARCEQGLWWFNARDVLNLMFYVQVEPVAEGLGEGRMAFEGEDDWRMSEATAMRLALEGIDYVPRTKGAKKGRPNSGLLYEKLVLREWGTPQDNPQNLLGIYAMRLRRLVKAMDIKVPHKNEIYYVLREMEQEQLARSPKKE